MKNIMTRAWEIAKTAAKKFGGKVKEYFASALKMSWKEYKLDTFVKKFLADVHNLSTELTVSNWISGNNHRIYINYGRKSKGYLVVNNNVVTDFENNASSEMMSLLRSYVGQRVA